MHVESTLHRAPTDETLGDEVLDGAHAALDDPENNGGDQEGTVGQLHEAPARGGGRGSRGGVVAMVVVVVVVVMLVVIWILVVLAHLGDA